MDPRIGTPGVSPFLGLPRYSDVRGNTAGGAFGGSQAPKADWQVALCAGLKREHLLAVEFSDVLRHADVKG